MEIVDLTEEHKQLFACCLEDWSDDAKEAGTRRARWVDRSLKEGLRAKLAIDDRGEVGGMIQYLPVERSIIDGEGLYFVHCVWVHGHAKGRGNFQKHGLGSALLTAAEADARERGANGMAAWGLWLPFWMRASWFKKRGYKKADRQGVSVLLWKSFSEDALKPRWLPKRRELPEPSSGKVDVTVFVHGWCMAMNLVAERAKRAAIEIGDAVVYREFDTSDREAMIRWGQTDAVFVDGKSVRNGPPPSYEKIRAIIAKRAARL